MAVTKIKAIRGTLNKALAYIMNPEKTDDKMLVSSYGCAAETAAQEFEWTRKIAEQQGMNPVKIIARHVIQSFDVGEVSPELAHEIGKQFADEILGGKYTSGFWTAGKYAHSSGNSDPCSSPAWGFLSSR